MLSDSLRAMRLSRDAHNITAGLAVRKEANQAGATAYLLDDSFQRIVGPDTHSVVVRDVAESQRYFLHVGVRYLDEQRG